MGMTKKGEVADRRTRREMAREEQSKKDPVYFGNSVKPKRNHKKGVK